MIKRFGAHCTLDQGDVALLARLGSEPRQVRAGDILWREGDPAASLLIVHAGWLYSAKYLQDGTRQLLEVLISGDILGFYGLTTGIRCSEAVLLTDGWVSELPYQEVLDLFASSPRMTTALFAMSNQRRAIIAERLMVMARRTAREKIAHFLCECRTRLLETAQVSEEGFILPLTQQDIADALGMSAVHVSRTFTSLTEEGLVQRKHFRLVIPNPAKLEELAGFDKQYLLASRKETASHTPLPAIPVK